MHEFSVILQKDIRLLINYFKAIPHNPKRLLLFVLYIGYFGFLAWMNIFPARETVSIFNPTLITGITLFYGALILLSNVASGYNEMFTFFKPADISILFASPLSPRVIMIAAIFKSSLSNLLLTLFIIVMGARVMIPAGTSAMSLIYVTTIVMVFNLSAQPMNFVLMRLKQRISRVYFHIVFSALWVVPLLVLFVQSGFKLGVWLSDSNIFYVPVVGWMAGIVLASYGASVPFWPVLLSLFSAFIATILGMCFWLADDYYEDVCGGIEKFAALRQRGREGKGNITKIRKRKKAKDMPALIKHDRTEAAQKHPDSSEILEENQTVLVSYQKETNPWYWKSLVVAEKKRRFPLFGILEVLLCLGAIGIVIATHTNLVEDVPLPYLYNGLVLYIIFLFSINGNQKMDFLTPKFVMSPGNPLFKLVSLLRLDFIKQILALVGINLILAFSKDVVFGFLALCLLAQVIVYLEVVTSNLLVHIFLKNSADVALMLPLLKVIQIALIIAPTIGVMLMTIKYTDSITIILSAIAITQFAIVSLMMGIAAWLANRLQINT